MQKQNVYEIKISDEYIAKYNLVTQANSKKEMIYGVGIELYDKANVLKTQNYINKVTDSYSKVMKIIDKLAQKTVTPISLTYVIDEICDSL